MPNLHFFQALPTFEIPTFTVTINPLESDEMTFVPGSPPAVSGENQPLLSGGNQNNSTSGGNNQTGNSNKFSTGNGNSMMSNKSIGCYFWFGYFRNWNCSAHRKAMVDFLCFGTKIHFSVYFLLFPYPKIFSHFFSSHWKK